MMWALFDQLQYSSHLKTFAKDQADLRQNISFDLFISTERLEWQYDPENGLPEEWKANMLEDSCFGDEIFLQLACNVLNRDIVIIPVFKDQAHIAALGFTIKKSSTPNNREPLFLFVFSESRFATPHYQSIRPEDVKNIINEYIDNNRDSLNSSRSTTLAIFHQSSLDSIFHPPLSSSSVGSSVSKFVVEGGRLVRRSQDLSNLVAAGSPPSVEEHHLPGNESRWVEIC